MQMKPLVSILIPAYNAQQWLSDTSESALAQTWEKTEIIVVDDGSTDQTPHLARKFASKSVRVVAQENRGAAAARNTAYAACQGDYIQWLDADDLIDPDKVEVQMRRRGDCATSRTRFSGGWGHFSYRRANGEVHSDRALGCDLAQWSG